MPVATALYLESCCLVAVVEVQGEEAGIRFGGVDEQFYLVASIVVAGNGEVPTVGVAGDLSDGGAIPFFNVYNGVACA